MVRIIIEMFKSHPRFKSFPLKRKLKIGNWFWVVLVVEGIAAVAFVISNRNFLYSFTGLCIIVSICCFIKYENKHNNYNVATKEYNEDVQSVKNILLKLDKDILSKKGVVKYLLEELTREMGELSTLAKIAFSTIVTGFLIPVLKMFIEKTFSFVEVIILLPYVCVGGLIVGAILLIEYEKVEKLYSLTKDIYYIELDDSNCVG
jgi:hypothetical protein